MNVYNVKCYVLGCYNLVRLSTGCDNLGISVWVGLNHRMIIISHKQINYTYGENSKKYTLHVSNTLQVSRNQFKLYMMTIICVDNLSDYSYSI